MPIPPCQKCGLCCTANYSGDSTYVDLSERDVDRLRKHRLKILYTQHGHAGLATKTTATGTRCVALKGKVLQSVSCSVYEDRPTLCRRFERGGVSCRYELQQAGLLEPTTLQRLTRAIYGREPPA